MTDLIKGIRVLAGDKIDQRMDLPASLPVEQLTVLLARRLEIPPSFNIIFEGRVLKPNETLALVGVVSADTLELMSGMTTGTNV